ncbi:MAG: D-alanine--D-alanine ligase [candidate division WOR-3 bacterium]
MSRSDLVRRLRKRRIGVLMGGWSSEREVSLLSGQRVIQSLNDQGFHPVGIDITRNFAEQIAKAKIDIAFVILHGRPGEDGTIQGFLELKGIPYTGSGVTASAIGMDKLFTKMLFRQAGIPTPDFVAISTEEEIEPGLVEAEKQFGYPMIIKPRNEGSSVGIELLTGKRGALDCCLRAHRGYGDFIIEPFVAGMIATVGILENEALPILELVPKRQPFYDYRAKYTRGETDFVVPARLDPKTEKRISELALKAHSLLGCRGFSRLDLVVQDSKHPYFLELNTLPGLTAMSDLPAEAEAAGISYDELVFRILAQALP